MPKVAKADPVCKLILLGNGSAGKSSIIARFTDDGFGRVYKQTVGLDFFEKLLPLQGDRRVKLELCGVWSCCNVWRRQGLVALRFTRSRSCVHAHAARRTPHVAPRAWMGRCGTLEGKALAAR